jgi:hypothetical protein
MGKAVLGRLYHPRRCKSYSNNESIDNLLGEPFLRKNVLPVALAAVVIVVAAGVTDYYATHTGIPQSGNSSCSDPDSISSHVYNPYRLNVINACTTASGVVENVFKEVDGDYHLRLALDNQYGNLTNTANVNYQYGDLVVEIICALPITQSDAVSACQKLYEHHYNPQRQ